MAMRNLTVTFHTNVYSKNWKGFQFPAPLARLLGRKKGKRLTLALTITKPSGETVFHGPALLTSGTEIGMATIFRNLQHGEEIRVTACAAPQQQKKSK
jgi:hypothetical protein